MSHLDIQNYQGARCIFVRSYMYIHIPHTPLKWEQLCLLSLVLLKDLVMNKTIRKQVGRTAKSVIGLQEEEGGETMLLTVYSHAKSSVKQPPLDSLI